MYFNSVSWNIIKVYHLSGKPMLCTESLTLYNATEGPFLPVQSTYVRRYKSRIL